MASCFDELKVDVPRSRPDHGPEVGLPVRLIFGDVAGWRNGGARPPYITSATTRGRRCSRRPVPDRRDVSPRYLIVARPLFSIL